MQIETTYLSKYAIRSCNIKVVGGLGRLGAGRFEIWLVCNTRSSEYLLTTLMPIDHACIRWQILELPLKY